MKAITWQVGCATAVVAMVGFLGCNNKPTAETPASVSETPPSTVEDEHGDHAHAHEGPHGGHIIELGRNHEYHAELVEDHDGQSVTLYMLDKDLKPLSIDAESITLNLAAEREPMSFDLAAADAANGKASQFVSQGSALFEALEKHEDATVKLRVTIDGSSYTGQMEHHEHDHAHDHEGHEGEHDPEKKS